MGVPLCNFLLWEDFPHKSMIALPYFTLLIGKEMDFLPEFGLPHASLWLPLCYYRGLRTLRLIGPPIFTFRPVIEKVCQPLVWTLSRAGAMPESRGHPWSPGVEAAPTGQTAR